jgi:hypothetical protein
VTATRAQALAKALLAGDDPALTLGDVLAHVADRLAPALVDAAGLARLQRIAGAVPATLSPFWGLELRLDDPVAQADILWEVRRDSRGAAMLAGSEGADLLAGLCVRAPVWQAMRRFAQGWTGMDAGHPGVHVGNVWFEVDAAAAADAVALETALTRPSLFWGARSETPGSDRALLAALPGLAERMFGLTLAPAPLAAAADALPVGAELFQLGVMGGRAGTLARLCLRGMAVPAAIAWLEAIGWPGDVKLAFGRLAPWLAMADGFALGVDVSGGLVGPKLGVELYGPPGEVDPVVWQPAFARLQAEGLALGAKTAAAMAWPGVERFSQAALWRRRTGRGHPVLARSIHHLKLVLTPEGLRDAKLYLAVYRPSFDYGAALDSAPGSQRDPWLTR